MTAENALSARALAGSTAPGSLDVSKLFDVKGWVAVVTGGGTGLGLLTATALADNGVKVYITGRRLEPLQKATRPKGENGGEIIAIQADASTKEGIASLRDQLEKDEKWINLLVNNHGVSLKHPDPNDVPQTAEAISKHMFDNDDFETWVQTHVINTASYNFTSFALLGLLSAAKTVGGYAEPGNIINISSMSGITKTSQRGQFSYNSSKAATISLSHMLATEFARRDLGVRVNVLCPGYFPSGMTVINPEDNAGSKEYFDRFRGKQWAVPFGRPGNAQDYSQAIISLAVNRYVTGTELIIDGGWLLESAF